MREATLLVAVLLLTAGLAGCLKQGDTLEQTDLGSTEDGAEADGDQDQGNEDTGTSEEDTGTGTSSDEAADGGSDASDGDGITTSSTPKEPAEDRPLTVLAHLDTGINPYHEIFRDDSDLADAHPSEYIDGYPEDATALNLTLDADSYEDAVRQDQDVWANVTPDTLYWIPGTRIDGAIMLGGGGTYCPVLGLPHDYLAGGIAREAPDMAGGMANDTISTAENESGQTAPSEAKDAAQNPPDPLGDCPEDRPILDDFGHGTMTASRSVGETTSLCPDCRLVTVEGTGGDSVSWVAEQGWIDVQTNSWVGLVPAPISQSQDGDPTGGNDTTTDAIANAADQMVTVFASGNGAGYLAGWAPTPTYTLSTAPPGVILVGAHDNGYFASWSGSPPHVIADGFRGLSAHNDSLNAVGPIPFTCCTSSSAPYAAGGAAKLVEAARTILGDTGNGIHDGIVAQGEAGVVQTGPLADGELNMTELRDVYFHTAQMPPQAGPHDGDRHWASQPEDGPNATNPAGNPYCGGCWTTPLTYDDLPPEVPPYVYTGYGSISPDSTQTALAVLAGEQMEPGRSEADQFYALDQTIRSAYYPS